MFRRLFILLLILLPFAHADPGMGLSTSPDESISVDKLPFIYNGNFRIYNTGDEERVFIVDVIAPFEDTLDWITVDTSIFSLLPDETLVVNFSIYIEKTYTGDYDLVFKPTLLPTQKPTETGSAAAFLSLSATYKLTVSIPGEVGSKSLGIRPPTTEPPAQNPEIAKIVSTSQEETSVKSLNKTIKLNAPEKVKIYEPTTLSVGFVEGGEPPGLGFLLVSPAEKQYRLKSNATFQFDEEGKWELLVVIENKVILGNTVQVEKDAVNTIKYNYMPKYGIAALVAVIVFIAVLGVVLKRRRK